MPNPAAKGDPESPYIQHDPKIATEAHELIEKMRAIQRDKGWSFQQLTQQINLLCGTRFSALTPAQWIRSGISTECESLKALRKFVPAFPIKVLGLNARGEFRPTKARMDIEVGLSIARRGGICILTGSSGVGKSYITRTIVALDPGVIRVNAYENISAMELLAKIAGKMGVTVGHERIADYRRAIIEYLVDNPSVILIDEATSLCNKRLNFLYQMSDDANERKEGCCGIFLVGIQTLTDKFARQAPGAIKKLVLEQFVSRIKWKRTIAGPDKMFAEKLVKDVLGEMSQDVLDHLVAMSRIGEDEISVRRLENLIDLIKLALRKGEKANMDMVDEAVDRLKDV